MTLRLMKAFCTKMLPHEGHAPSMQSCQQQIYTQLPKGLLCNTYAHRSAGSTPRSEPAHMRRYTAVEVQWWAPDLVSGEVMPGQGSQLSPKRVGTVDLQAITVCNYVLQLCPNLQHLITLQGQDGSI